MIHSNHIIRHFILQFHFETFQLNFSRISKSAIFFIHSNLLTNCMKIERIAITIRKNFLSISVERIFLFIFPPTLFYGERMQVRNKKTTCKKICEWVHFSVNHTKIYDLFPFYMSYEHNINILYAFIVVHSVFT